MCKIIEIYDKEIETKTSEITKLFMEIADKQGKTLKEVVEVYYNIIQSRKEE